MGSFSTINTRNLHEDQIPYTMPQSVDKNYQTFLNTQETVHVRHNE